MANEAFESGFQGGIGAAQKKKKDAKPSSTIFPSFEKGGKVKKTGLAKLHKGELVLTAREAKGKSSKKKSTRKKVSSKR